MTTPKEIKLGEILLKQGLITEAQLIAALQEQKQTREFLGQILVKRGFLTEDELAKAIAQQFGMPFVKLEGQYVDWTLSERFDSSLITKYMCVPLRVEGRIMIVAIVNPLDAWLRSRIEQISGADNVRFVVMGSGDMTEAVELYEQHIRSKIQSQIKKSEE